MHVNLLNQIHQQGYHYKQNTKPRELCLGQDFVSPDMAKKVSNI